VSAGRPSQGTSVVDRGEQAILRDDATTLVHLIRDGFNVNVHNADGTTPLMRAAGSGSARCAVVLLQAGAHIEATDSQGLTPLMHAAKGRATAVAKLLLEAGVDPSSKDTSGSTALGWARRRARLRIRLSSARFGAGYSSIELPISNPFDRTVRLLRSWMNGLG
jgi:ankyrin repeat protein